jgi:hypothetical protein
MTCRTVPALSAFNPNSTPQRSKALASPGNSPNRLKNFKLISFLRLFTSHMGGETNRPAAYDEAISTPFHEDYECASSNHLFTLNWP